MPARHRGKSGFDHWPDLFDREESRESGRGCHTRGRLGNLRAVVVRANENHATIRRSLALVSMLIRKLHAYIGMLIAPSVLFFAATGTLQIYNLHEAHAGYTPPPVIEALSAVHKDQRFGAGHKHPAEAEHAEGPAAAGPHADAPHEDAAPHKSGARKSHMATILLKAFFTLVAIGLIGSTLAGLWMALQQRVRRTAHLVLLLIGALVPAILAALTT
jgi:hypothetical protein